MGDRRYVEIACTYVHHTNAAVLVDTGDGKCWVPRSLLQDEPDFSSLKEEQSITLDVPEWWAQREGLI